MPFEMNQTLGILIFSKKIHLGRFQSSFLPNFLYCLVKMGLHGISGAMGDHFPVSNNYVSTVIRPNYNTTQGAMYIYMFL